MTLYEVYTLCIALGFCFRTAAQPLPSDPRLVSGQLPNGLKYIVMKHGNPPARASMWLHVSTGSLNETDSQRGIAHYLEHMAFNGSQNFPPGSVVPFFQSLGLNFGQHQNAFTSFDQTTYQLSMPDVNPETIDKAMGFFADVKGRLSLLPEEIEEERQIILEEKRSRLSAAQRVQDYFLERLAPGSLIGQRLPIGVEETIKGVQPGDFQDYYGRYYTPSNMTLIVVADAEPAKVVEHITKNFSFGEAKPAAPDQDPKVTPYSTPFGVVATDPELTEASVSLLRISAPRPPVTTYERLRDQWVDQLGQAAFNRRMGKKINDGATAYLSASAFVSDFFQSLQLAQASANGKPEDWKRLLTELGTDVQRARLHGFSEREIEDVKKEVIAQFEQFVAQESSIPAQFLLRQMNTQVAEGNTILSASQLLDAARKEFPTLTAPEISARFAAQFDPAIVAFSLEAPSTAPELPTEPELLALGRAAFSVTPGAEAEAERPNDLLAALPEPGAITSTTEHTPSAVSTGVLASGVTVHHRFMDIRKDDVTVTINLAAGTIQETADNRGVAEAAGLAWGRPATSTLTSTNIRDIMTGKKVRVGGAAGDDTLTLTVSGSPEDLETGMQLAYLMLTDPVIEPAAFEQWKKSTQTAIEERGKSPQAAFDALLERTLYPEDQARTQPLTLDQLNRVGLESAQSWLKNAVATAPIEVSIIGDLPKERAMELAARYLGSLPKRAVMTKDTLDAVRAMPRKQGPIVKNESMATLTPVAMVMAGFYGPDAENVPETRLMIMAGRIMSTRMLKRIREEEQLAYSPGAGFRPGVEYPGYGVFISATSTEPQKVDRLSQVYGEMLSEFARTGPTEDEMTTVKKQMANTLDEQMKQPPFWSQRVSAMTYRNTRLDDLLNANDFYQKATADEVKAVYAKYFTPQNSLRAVLMPAAAAAEPAQPAEGAATAPKAQ